MQKRHQNRKLYFEEQDYTTRRYVIPFIEQHQPLYPGMRILEIGCGDGGNLKPFLERGCQVTGVDLSENKIELARRFFADDPDRDQLALICDDIYNLEPAGHRFDLILMRDVIEHIHNQERFMAFVKRFLSRQGLFLLVFPPWQNPFGGHQQVCQNRLLSHLPYFHLLPTSCYRFVLKTGGESRATIDGLLEIKETGISIEHFESILKKENYRLLRKTLYLVNPNYEIKFGLKPRKQAAWMARLPGVRNFFTTTAYYLIDFPE